MEQKENPAFIIDRLGTFTELHTNYKTYILYHLQDFSWSIIENNHQEVLIDYLL